MTTTEELVPSVQVPEGERPSILGLSWTCQANAVGRITQPSLKGGINVLRAAVSRPAVPAEPISAILDAFKTHQVVAFGRGQSRQHPGPCVSSPSDSRSSVRRDGR